MQVRCRCGRYIPIILLNEDDRLEETGNPKWIGTGKCICEREIRVYASIYRSE